MKWRGPLALWGVFLTLLLTAEAVAGPIRQEVHNAMEAAGTGGEVSVIVRLSDQADMSRLEGLPRKALRTRMLRVLQEKAKGAQGPMEDFLRSRGVERKSTLWIMNGMVVTASPQVIRELALRSDVAEIKLDRVIPLYRVSNSPVGVAEWNINAVHVRELWALGFAGQRTVVANLDTGVDLNHPDLKSRYRGGTNSWFDPYGKHAVPFDGYGHGTMTMGVMVGGDAGGTAIGVAPKARWIAAKIFDDSGGALESAIHQSFQWVLDPDGNPDTDDAPDVVNNSWGSDDPECSRAFAPDILALKTAGIAVVFAAGNEGFGVSTSSDPADNPGAFSVGSVGEEKIVSGFSSRGPSLCDGRVFPNVVAPGEGIRTSSPVSGPPKEAYAEVYGTSFSAPHVSGAMALLLSAFPGLTVTQLEQALTRSALDLGDSGPDNDYGSGLIRVRKAYLQIMSQSKSMTLSAVKGLNGWVRESARGSRKGGCLNTTSSLLVGDNAQGLQFKAVVSFDTSKIPKKAVITSARLVLALREVSGRDPFESLGACYVDVLDRVDTASTLRANSFQASARVDHTARVSEPVSTTGESRGALDEAGLKALNRQGLTRLRVYFSKGADSNGINDQIRYWSDNGLPEQRPKLLITYMVP